MGEACPLGGTRSPPKLGGGGLGVKWEREIETQATFSS